MKKLMRNKKGASMILGVLLLVLTTVTFGVFYYSYTAGLIGSMENNFSTQMSALLVEVVNINTTCITAYIKNTGIAITGIINAYVNSIPAVLSEIVELLPSNISPVTIFGNYDFGSTYHVKLASSLGTLITFDASL